MDFVVGDILIETKGRFTSEDRKKMLLVTEQHPDKKILMVFDRAIKKLYKGSPTTYAQWCDKNGILWLDLKSIKENTECLSSMIKQKMDSRSKIQQKKN